MNINLFALQIIEDFVSKVCQQAEVNIQTTGKLEGAHYAAMMKLLKSLQRGAPSAPEEKWIVGQPGGPSGPFYSVVTQRGRMVAMQIPDKNDAYQISQIPQLLHRQRDWASLINRLATLVINGKRSSNDLDEANEAIAEVLPFIK